MKKRLPSISLGSNPTTFSFTKKTIPLILLCILGILSPFKSLAQSDLFLTLATDVTNYDAYEHVVYEVVVQNLGPATATNVSASFPLPNGMVYSSSDATHGSYNLYAETWDIGTLEFGQTVLLSIDLFTLDDDGPKMAFAQIQTVDQTDPDSSPGNDTDQIPDEDDEALVTIYPTAQGGTTDLRLELLNDQSDIFYDGGPMTVVVHNDGPNQATGISVRINTNINSHFIGSVSPSQGTTNITPGSTVFTEGNWVVGTLNPGASATLEIEILFVDQYHTAYIFAQIQASDQFDPDSTPGSEMSFPYVPNEDDEGLLIKLGGGGPPGDLELSMVSSQVTGDAGDQITFTITIQNNGSFPSPNVSIKDILPTDLNYISSTANIGTYDPLTGLWSVGFLAERTYPGAPSTLVTEATLSLVTSIINIDNPIANFAQVETGYDIDATPGNDTDQVVDEDDEAKVTIYEDGYAFPDLAITAFSNFQPFPPGGTVVTFFDLFNLGTGPTPEEFSIAVFLSTDDELSEFDYPVGERTITDLVPGPGVIPEIPVEVTAPAFLSPGEYYLFYVIDADFIIDESNEHNNVDLLPIEISSICAGDLILNSQAEVDAVGICTEIEGNLYIGSSTSSDITDLSPLYQITKVHGNVMIENNPNLNNLIGLNALESVGTWCFIRNNEGLSSLRGLFSLESIGGPIYIGYNDALVQINDLQHLTTVGGDVFLELNPSLEDVTGLSGLITVGGNLAFLNHASLETIIGPPGLLSTGMGLSISGNEILTSIGGFNSLTSINGGYLSIRLNPMLNNIAPFPVLHTVEGTVRVQGNNALTHLDGLSSITSIGNDLSIILNPALTDCCGIHPLLEHNGVGGNIMIYDNPASCSSEQEILDQCISVNYCASYAEFPWHEWISHVQLNTINNGSGKSQYTDLRAIGTTLEKGNSYPTTLEASFSYTTYDEYWRVWIDFNRNGSLNDPGEMVIDQVLSSPPDGTPTASISGNVYVPLNAVNGDALMRVSMQRGSAPSPCAVLSFGEVEDYTITISGATTAILALECPEDVFVNVPPGADGTTVTWNLPNYNTTCPGNLVSLVQTGGQPNGSFFETGTYFIEYTATDNCGNQEVCEFVLSIEESSGYCASEGDAPWHEWIGRLQFAGVDKSSGKSKYSDFTALHAMVENGSSYPISLQSNFSYTTYDEYWRVWIDFNQNGSFYDAGEMVFNEVLSGPPDGTPFATISGSISIPDNAMEGNTRMRVAMQRGSAPSPCGTIPFGEVEDYTVSIANSFNGGSGIQMRSNEVQVALFPNPAINEVYVNLNKHIGQSATIWVHNLYGKTLFNLEIEEIPNFPIRINLNGMDNGLYFLSTRVDNLKMTTKRLVIETTK